MGKGESISNLFKLRLVALLFKVPVVNYLLWKFFIPKGIGYAPIANGKYKGLPLTLAANISLQENQ